MEKLVIFDSAIKVLNSALNNEPISEEFKMQLLGNLKAVYKLLKFNGFNHVFFNFFKDNNLEISDDINDIFKKDYLTCLYKTENASHINKKIIQVLTESKIKHVILKGEELKKYYPKTLLRPSADIDVLVEESNLKKACDALRKNFNIVKSERNYHDVTLTTDLGVIIELHFSLSENNKNLDLVTNDWKNNLVNGNTPYNFNFNNEFLICYLITHTAYHFYNGGTGIKPFIDLYLLLKNIPFDDAVIINRLKLGELNVFYESVLALISVWFYNKPHTNLTLKMQEFVFNGGEYGNYYQSNKNLGDKKSRLLKKVFLPYKTLCNYYPILKKVCVLYPVFIVIRCFKVIFSKQKLESANNQIKATSISQTKKQELTALFKELNLK